MYGGSFEAGWKKAVIEPFEKANPDIKVAIATGLTLQNVALMRAQRDNVKVDVIMMDEVGAAQANAESLYEPLDPKKIANLSKLYPQFRVKGDPYTKFMYVSQAIAYNKEKIKTPPGSYRNLWKPEYKGRVAIPDINTSHGAFLLLMAATMNGGSVQNIDPGFALLKELKPSIVTFWNQHAQVSQLFTQGDIWITTWTTDRAQGLIDAGGPVAWTIPREGGLHHRLHHRHRQGYEEARGGREVHRLRAERGGAGPQRAAHLPGAREPRGQARPRGGGQAAGGRGDAQAAGDHGLELRDESPPAVGRAVEPRDHELTGAC